MSRAVSEDFISKEYFIELVKEEISYAKEAFGINPKISRKILKFLDALWELSEGNIIKPSIHKYDEGEDVFLQWTRTSEGFLCSMDFIKDNNDVFFSLVNVLFGRIGKGYIFDCTRQDELENMSDLISLATKRKLTTDERKHIIHNIKNNFKLGNIESFRNLLDKEVDSMNTKINKFIDKPDEEKFSELRKKSKTENIFVDFYENIIGESVEEVSSIIKLETGKKTSKKKYK